jgi:hypothetical protein
VIRESRGRVRSAAGGRVDTIDKGQLCSGELVESSEPFSRDEILLVLKKYSIGLLMREPEELATKSAH